MLLEFAQRPSNRKAIAEAGAVKLLVAQLRGASSSSSAAAAALGGGAGAGATSLRARELAVFVLALLVDESPESDENVARIVGAGGIRGLTGLLGLPHGLPSDDDIERRLTGAGAGAGGARLSSGVISSAVSSAGGGTLDAEAQAKAAGYANWVQFFKYKSDWRLNVDLPTIAAWKMTQPINTQTWMLERNPYFYEVDTAGNQLPYIDRVQMALAENPEVVNLRAIAGEYDVQERFIDIAKLPVFLENQERGKYKYRLDLGFNGSDSQFVFNLSYRADPEVAKWIANADFRRALSIAIDRDQLNETFWLGLGTPGSGVPSEVVPESPGKEWIAKWSVFDKAKANAMLDAIGLTKKDREGYRLRTDNGERLRLQIDVAQTLNPTWPQQVEMVIQQWRAVGIAADMKLLERSLFFTRIRNDQHQMVLFSNSGSESLFLFPTLALPVDPAGSLMGSAYSQWYASGGASGVKPEDPNLLRVYELMRSAPTKGEDDRNEDAREIWRLAADAKWQIGLVGQAPGSQGNRVVSNRMGNIPERICISQHCRPPWSARPEQWYFR
jgi:peptide/nickel transport system substrate-binding protein